MDMARSLDYADSIIHWCAEYHLNESRFIALVNWESGFVNNIRDRKLPFNSWSYGLTGIQLETAKRALKRLRIERSITGRDLVLDFDLNVRLGAEQMRFLLDHRCHKHQRQAEMSYNAGYNGMLKGRGQHYPIDIDWCTKQWIQFQEEHDGSYF